jgi:hypothetical protein
LGSEVTNYLYTEGEPLEKAVKGIVAGMSEDGKTKMRDNREWVQKVNELVELEKDHDQYETLDEMLRMLGQEVSDDDEESEEDGESEESEESEEGEEPGYSGYQGSRNIPIKAQKARVPRRNMC